MHNQNKINILAVCNNDFISSLYELKDYLNYKDAIESAVITYLKEENLYNMLLNEVREIPEINEEPYMTCFGFDVFEKNDELISEYEYAQTL